MEVIKANEKSSETALIKNDSEVEAIVVPNTLWTSTNPQAYSGGLPRQKIRDSQKAIPCRHDEVQHQPCRAGRAA